MTAGKPLCCAVIFALAFVPACAKKSTSPQPQPSGGSVESFNSGVFSIGNPPSKFVHRFNMAGTYGYRCLVHGSSMSGAVQVTDTHPDDSAFVNIGDNFFSPSLVQVKTGGYVKWIANNSDHGVRSD